MAYEKQTWIDDVTPATADRLNHIEDGIEQVYADVDESLEPYVAHDGTPQVGDMLSVKSINPLVVERRGLPQDRLLVKGGAVHAMDDEFDDGVISPSWIESHVMNPTVTVATEAAGVFSIKHAGTADTTTQPTHAWLKPIESMSYPFVIEGAFRSFRRYATNYMMFGLLMTDGLLSSSKAMWMMPYASTSTAAAHTLSTRYGTRASVATDSGSVTWEHPGGPLFQRLTAVSANQWRAEYSPDGVSWIQYPAADWTYAMTPTHVGFAVANWAIGGNQAVGTVEYFRVYQPPHERTITDRLGVLDGNSPSFVYNLTETNPLLAFDSIVVEFTEHEELTSPGLGLLDDISMEIGYGFDLVDVGGVLDDASLVEMNLEVGALSDLGALDDVTPEVIP